MRPSASSNRHTGRPAAIWIPPTQRSGGLSDRKSVAPLRISRPVSVIEATRGNGFSPAAMVMTPGDVRAICSTTWRNMRSPRKGSGSRPCIIVANIGPIAVGRSENICNERRCVIESPSVTPGSSRRWRRNAGAARGNAAVPVAAIAARSDGSGRRSAVHTALPSSSCAAVTDVRAGHREARTSGDN
jgi:hypothetical protein